MDGGQRIATADGAMLADPDSLGNLPGVAPGTLFEPAFWASRGELADVTGGRGAAWFIGESMAWVLRHYRRGGAMARLAGDLYLWTGETRVRAFAEWHLLAILHGRRLPVPKPIGARYRRTGIFYRCDLITRRIADTHSLSSVLAAGSIEETTWRDIGAVVARVHAAGADHGDLNAHNILLDGKGVVSIIDFDRSRLRASGAWSLKNLARLRRSLIKIARGLPPDRFPAAAWDWLLAGYTAAAALVAP